MTHTEITVRLGDNAQVERQTFLTIDAAIMFVKLHGASGCIYSGDTLTGTMHEGRYLPYRPE